MESSKRPARSRRKPGPGRPRISNRADTGAARALRDLIASEPIDREWSFAELLQGLRTLNPGRTEYWYRMIMHRGTADLMEAGMLFRPRPGRYSPTATPMALAYRMFASVETAHRALNHIRRKPDSPSKGLRQTAAIAAQNAFNLFTWWIGWFNKQASDLSIPPVSLRKLRRPMRAIPGSALAPGQGLGANPIDSP
jgi:hypothetical protein